MDETIVSFWDTLIGNNHLHYPTSLSRRRSSWFVCGWLDTLALDQQGTPRSFRIEGKSSSWRPDDAVLYSYESVERCLPRWINMRPFSIPVHLYNPHIQSLSLYLKPEPKIKVSAKMIVFNLLFLGEYLWIPKLRLGEKSPIWLTDFLSVIYSHRDLGLRFWKAGKQRLCTLVCSQLSTKSWKRLHFSRCPRPGAMLRVRPCGAATSYSPTV